MSGQSPVILLMGPTAAGKTQIAGALAQMIGGEVVSVDSCAVYRGLDIGTAKPTATECKSVPHHLVDVAEPSERYSVGRFFDDACAALDGIAARGRTAIMAGGTMMYFNALMRGLSDLPSASADMRAEVARRIDEEGVAAVHDWLVRHDPRSAARIHPNDRQRISRAVEVLLDTGRTLSEWLAGSRRRHIPMPSVAVSLVPQDIASLRIRIRSRLDGFIAQGWVGEVSNLLARDGIDPESPSMRSVGYRQIVRHVLGEISLDAAIEQANIASRRLAKRQSVWLRSMRDFAFEIDPDSRDCAGAILRHAGHKGCCV